MKKIIAAFTLLLVATSMNSFAQNQRTLKKVMELKMPKTAEEDMCGTRGAGVCWNPVTLKYYAVFAGNASFPMAVFDAKGKRISNDELTAQVDTRGIWYNSKTKKICGNGYDDNGWFTYTLDKKGIPSEYNVEAAGMNQPDAQSVGAYDAKTGYVFFFNKGDVSFYTTQDATSSKSIALQLGVKKGQDPLISEELESALEKYNSTTAVATGIKNGEIGLLNVLDKQIELYDMVKGNMQQVFKLPEDAKTEDMFNFAYANGIFWLFDIEKRTWIGYK